MDTGIIDRQRTGWTAVITAHTIHRAKNAQQPEAKAEAVSRMDGKEGWSGQAEPDSQGGGSFVATRFERAAGKAKQIFMDGSEATLAELGGGGTLSEAAIFDEPLDLDLERYNNTVATARARRERFKAVAIPHDSRNVWEMLRGRLRKSLSNAMDHVKHLFG